MTPHDDTRRHAQVLIDLLTVELSEDRRDAAKLIGLRGDLSGAAGLQVAAQDRDGSVRVQAVKALGELRNAESVGTVVAAMSDRSAQVRHCGVVAAGQIGDLSAAADVVARLGDKQEQVAQAAAATLHELQCEESLQVPQPPLGRRV